MSVRRLVLFDIDGTLLLGGPAKDAFETAMVEVFGTAGDIDGLSFAGKTDPQIARELLLGSDVAADDIEAGLPSLWTKYTGHLQAQLPTRPVRVLPGVERLLDRLSERDDVGLGLLTGNIERGARLKLGSAGLADRFGWGAFASDHEERNELPAIALQRARERWGRDFQAQDAVVVGDTPRDVECGRRWGTHTVAVATGSYEVAQLEAAGPDHVLEDFTETEQVVALLSG